MQILFDLLIFLRLPIVLRRYHIWNTSCPFTRVCFVFETIFSSREIRSGWLHIYFLLAFPWRSFRSQNTPKCEYLNIYFELHNKLRVYYKLKLILCTLELTFLLLCSRIHATFKKGLALLSINYYEMYYFLNFGNKILTSQVSLFIHLVLDKEKILSFYFPTIKLITAK